MPTKRELDLINTKTLKLLLEKVTLVLEKVLELEKRLDKIGGKKK